MLITILLIAAIVLFLIPVARALVTDSRLDCTNAGLACLAGALLVSNGVLL